jgi:ParB-like chromosome segregation protein Spo0J
MTSHLEAMVALLSQMSIPERVEALNSIRRALHEVSPFKGEPFDCVLWFRKEAITANDYNPNSVAPPEMELLKKSVLEDGYTQPIVGWPVAGGTEVIDGFHRNRVGRECPEIEKRVHGYLPVAVINEERRDRGDRIAATIRHNRARGKHKVEAMSDIVIELKRRNWSSGSATLRASTSPPRLVE